jgi:creatinine amidohydrolase
MTWQEVEEAMERSGGVAILPVGSIEQHAFHAPTGTDSMVAIGVAEDVAKKTGAVVIPPLWFGWSPQHMGFPGTISIRPDILSEMVVDICASMSAHGFNKIVIINGHRITNIPWLQLAAAKAREKTDATVLIADLIYMAKKGYEELDFGSVGHADEAETSHMLYLHKDLIYMDRAKKYSPPQEKYYHVDPRSTEDTLIYLPSSPEVNLSRKEISGGGRGNPTLATVQKGRRLHEILVNNIVEIVNELKSKRMQMQV